MSKFKQINTLIGGLNLDIDEDKETPNSYRDAVNMVLTEEGGITSLSSVKGDYRASIFVDSGQQWHSSFSCEATFGSSKEVRSSVLVFSQNPTTLKGAIYILDTKNDTLFRIYHDEDSPSNPRPSILDLGDEIDIFTLKEDGDYFAYWVDDKNPARYIKLHVEDETQVDNSGSPESSLYIANECDLLYVPGLYPVDHLTVDAVLQNGGGLVSGNYSFSYRYYNTVSGKYSKWTLFTNPVPVIPPDTSSESTNSIRGGLPGEPTSKSIRLELSKSHYHNRMYNCIQLGVVRSSGTWTEPTTLSILRPSVDYYGSADGVSSIVYTGNEAAVSETIETIVIDDAGIESGKTIEEQDGRFYLSNVRYFDDETPDPSSVSAQTIIEELDINVDPMVSAPASGKGYYDEINNHKFRGYFRGEVYRFSRSFVGKFGQFSRPKPLDMSSSSLDYDSGNHATTWQLNHATDGTDWKFAPRESQEGALFNAAGTDIRAMGLEISNLDNHPDWAYGMFVTRMKRKKNILGQTPVINSVAYQGGSFQDYWSLELSGGRWTNYFYEEPYSWDYDGNQDYYGPKVMAYGHAKNLTHATIRTGVSPKSDFHYLVWERLGSRMPGPVFDNASHDGKTYKKRNNQFLFLYPLEYLANAAGDSSDEINLDGSEFIKVVDCVSLEAFNAYRDEDKVHGYSDSSTAFEDGQQARYVFIYSPKNHTAYYYNNAHDPGSMLGDNLAASASETYINVAPESPLRISGGYKMGWGSPVQPLDSAYSSDAVMIHVRNILGGNELSEVQVENPNEYWDDIDMPAPHPMTTQRCIAVAIPMVEDPTSTENDFIYDPTFYMYEKYVGGSKVRNYSDVFAGNNDIDANAISESYAADSFTQAEADLARADHGVNPIISPGTSIPVYVANIEKGLGDDRYGSIGQAQESIFTGAYTPITKSDVDLNSPKSLSVWGGDCYITRNSFQIRDNAPRMGSALVPQDAATTPAQAPQYAPLPSTSPVDYLVDRTTRMCTYAGFVEIVDLWVESTINGHYVYRTDKQYPSGIVSRDAGSSDLVGNPTYSYPENAGITPYVDSWLYLYTPGYSMENVMKKFYSQDSTENKLSRVGSRIHYSTQRVVNSGDLNIDFLTNDYEDLDPSYGDIVKQLRVGGKKHIIVQENAIAAINIGNVTTESTDGLSISVRSGDTIGYVQYLDSNNESSGDSGGFFLKAIKKTDDGIYVLDTTRGKMLKITNGVQDISYGKVDSFFASEMTIPHNRASERGKVIMWWDQARNRVGVYRNSTQSGISFITSLQAWESRWIYSNLVEVADIVTSGRDTYAFVNRNNIPFLYKLYASDDRSAHMGEDNDFEMSYVLNNMRHRHMPKVLSNVIMQSSSSPTSADVSVEEDGTTSPRQIAVDVPFRKNRHNNYIANEFRDAEKPSRRISDPNILIRIFFAARPGVMRISNITTNYRLKNRKP